MNEWELRKREVAQSIALRAECQPLLKSGLWFHGDIRDNFYFASYLFAEAIWPAGGLADSQKSKQKAESVLLRVLKLQQQNEEHVLYGHFPLNLHPSPEQASPHELPVELMGSLMVYFHSNYGQQMSPTLQEAFEAALLHIYRSGFYRRPLERFIHHEAKYTSAKLIFGWKYGDMELFEEGKRDLRVTLERIKSKGMPEYGCLPWFWHWVQAFTCARELAEDGEVKRLLEDMLDYLWTERATFYLNGAWAGAHSRGWPHDVPADANVLHDYVQFGDFPLPDTVPRTEYAGFLFYPAPEAAQRTALERSAPSEVRRQICKGETEHQPLLHSYTYITRDFAAGGIWERFQEYDNEQVRWMVSFSVDGNDGANQLYFYHPGEGYSEGDPRHQSEQMEALYYKNIVLSVFPIPHPQNRQVLGILPKGEWDARPFALFGKIRNCYVSIRLNGHYSFEEKDAYMLVRLEGTPAAVAIEIIGRDESAALEIESLADFIQKVSENALRVEEEKEQRLHYRSLQGERLELMVEELGRIRPLVNGMPIPF